MINALAEAVKNIKNAVEKQLNKKSTIRIFPSKNCFAILVGITLHYEHFPIYKKAKKNTVYILNRVLFVYLDKLFLFVFFHTQINYFYSFLYPNTYFLFDIWIIFFLQYHPAFYRYFLLEHILLHLAEDRYLYYFLL